MKVRPLSRYDLITVDPLRGGFSDIRLWPFYLVFSSLILFLAPQIGMSQAIVLVGVPSFVIAKMVADKSADNEPIIRYDIDQWYDDLVVANAKGLPIPEMADYAVIVPKVKKVEVAKHAKKARLNPQHRVILKTTKVLNGFGVLNLAKHFRLY